MASYPVTVTDGIGSADHDGSITPVLHYTWAVAEAFRLPEALALVRSQSASITDAINLHDAVVNALGVVVTELIGLHDQQAPNQHTQLAIVEHILATEFIARGLPLSLVDGIGMALVQSAAQLIKIVETLGLDDVVGPAVKYHLTIAEKITYIDLLARFIGASVSENMQLLETLFASALKPGSITDGVDIAEDVSSTRLVLRVLVDETVELTDAELIKMIFDGVIVEGLELAAAYLGPNGSITTWAMNTRTAAVTEYTNYAFNSFARVGNKYLGATKDGLYELIGDTDSGTSIIADLKSGLAQFAGAHLSSFKGVYIAARGGGSYVLKLFTGDGSQYNYAVTLDSMKTARVQIGKGIRARYFAFELISTGQDFDLESLEFIPLVAKRRV